MKRQPGKRVAALLLALALAASTSFAVPAPVRQVYAYTERAATVNASTLNVRSGPGTSYPQVGSLSKGTALTVINEVSGSNGSVWYQVRFSGGGGPSTGYVLGTYVRFPVVYNYDSDFESYLAAQGFPESYRESLRQLHARYPKWIFQAQHTGLDWNTAIQNESMIPRSLIHTSSISSYKSTADGAYNWDNGTWTGFDGSSWVAASEEILQYYMDPRNFLDEVYIFQFMNHKYDPATQTREGLQELVKGTFLEGGVPSDGSAGNWDGGQGSGSHTAPAENPGGTPGPSTGVITSPGTGAGSGGPGAGKNGGPGSAQDSEVRLRAPQASISKHEAGRVASSVRVGVKPGQGGAATQAPGSSGPSGGASPSPVVTSNNGASSPTARPQGGTPSSPGGSPSPSGNVPSSPVGPSSPAADPENGGSASTVSYVDILLKAAEVSGVSPYVLASMIIQEQGSNGRGNSITGTNSAYPGYYNYFNVGAYAANGMGAVERGLWYASQSGNYGRPWNSPEKSILGGAQFYGENYVKAGQDTFYLKKYNVQGDNLYNHQYMTNVDGAASEGSIFAESYSSKLNSMSLVFKIPVYGGMPDAPCAKPTGDGSPNNKLKGLAIEGFSMTPTFSRDTYSYDVIVDNSVGMVSVQAQAIDSAATVSGTGMVQLASGSNEIRIRVRAQNGTERDYLIHIVRQGGGVYNGGSGGSPGGVQGPGGGPGGQTGTPANPGGSNVIVITP